MSERDQLRKAIAVDVLAMHYQDEGRAQRDHKIVACSCGFDGNHVTWRRHVADAVLAVIDQQGWVSPEVHAELRAQMDAAHRIIMEARTGLELAGADDFHESIGDCIGLLANHRDDLAAERDAALREAARFEPIGVGHGKYPNRAIFATTGDALEEWMAEYPEDWLIYRQVTEGEEG